MTRLSDSPFWPQLWRAYAKAPSIALCRVPEMMYAAQLSIAGKMTLDHCCGDGKFAEMVWGKTSWAAGCDFDAQALEAARQRHLYRRLDHCDVSERLPYEDAVFDLVFNNSALEHVREIDKALAEISRVLKPQGVLAFNVLNHRYFSWWPLDAEAERAYRAWQPFYHAWDVDTWRVHLAAVGLHVTEVKGYFDRPASQQFAQLDYAFSSASLAHRSSGLVAVYHRLRPLMRRLLKWQLGRYAWDTAPDAGAGYFIKAVRNA